MYFIDVILPIPLKQTFTYSVNVQEAEVLQTGMRVAVPFGKAKIFTGIVARVYEGDPPEYEVKAIDQILDESPIVNLNQLKHWLWMANYYMCTLGEVIRAGLPGSFLLESETQILLNSETEVEDSKLSNDEFLVYEALQYQSALHINEIRTILDRKNILKVIQSLMHREVVTIQEEIVDKYKPKLVRYIRFNSNYSSEEALRELLDSLNRAPKQREVLMNLFMLSAGENKPISTALLQKRSNTTSAIIKTLIDKEILEDYYIQKDRLEYSGGDVEEVKTLNEDQENALKEIKESFKIHDVTLLHGVTSSGKTEIYVKLIEEMLDRGKQVLYMLPEIVLTSQLIRRLQKYFGEKVSVYHSKFSSNERVEIWRNVLNREEKAQIIIGARSTLFLPCSALSCQRQCHCPGKATSGQGGAGIGYTVH
jgi:primosomal protein N' (replication factor Y)